MVRALLTSTVLAAALVGFVAAPTSSAEAQTLAEALGSAYASNPTLQARRARLRAADEGVPQAKAGWRPNVSFVGESGALRRRTNSGASLSESANDSRGFYSLTLQATQNVYDGGGTEAGVARAEFDVLAERARLRDVERSVLKDTVTAYMNVVRDQAVLRLNDQNLERLQRQLEATRDRFEVGEVTRTDVAQAESRLARARSNREEAAGNLEVSRAAYEELVGEAPGVLKRPEMQLDLPGSRNEAKAMAEQRSPSVQAAIFDRRSSLRAIDVQFADLLPDIDITGELSRNYNVSARSSMIDEAQVSATLTVPIYQQGFETSQLRESKHAAAEALSTIEEARRDATERAASTWETYLASLAVIQATDEEVRAAEIALEGVQQEEAVGARTVLDVLDAEQELLDAQVSLVQAQRDLTVAQYDLTAAVGGLTARDLGLNVKLFNDKAYYNEVKDRWWGLGDDAPASSYDGGKPPIEE